jgi:hypothetical protein
MTPGNIRLFRRGQIAIFRPNKKTYSLLGWNNNGTYWSRNPVDPEYAAAATIRTHTLPPAPVLINTIPNNTTVNLNVKCKATGKYLFYDNMEIPIVIKERDSPRSFSDSMYNFEFTCTATSEETPGTEALWTLYTAEPRVVYTLLTPPQILEPIPQRIAWLIAEDASKRGDTCSITLDEISPITASVTTCFHTFDANAIATWFQTNDTCPMCKRKTIATPAYTNIPSPVNEPEVSPEEAHPEQAPILI